MSAPEPSDPREPMPPCRCGHVRERHDDGGPCVECACQSFDEDC